MASGKIILTIFVNTGKIYNRKRESNEIKIMLIQSYRFVHMQRQTDSEIERERERQALAK